VGLFLGGATGALALAVAPFLVEASEEPKKVEKRVKVIVTDDGHETVTEEEGLPGGAVPRSFAFFGEGMGGGRLGIGLADVTKDDLTKLKLQEERGALVKSVEPESAAAKAGLEEGDVIVRFQGEAVGSAASLARMVRETPAGRTVAIEILRAGTSRKLTATLGEPKEVDVFVRRGLVPHPPMAPAPPPPPPMPEMGAMPEHRLFRWKSDDGKGADIRILHGPEQPRLGVRLQDIDGQLAAYFKVASGKGVLVTSVDEGSAAAKAGVKAGDVVQRFSGSPVTTSAELRQAVREGEAGKATTLTVWRDGKAQDLTVTLPASPKPRQHGRSI
jgi:serine protease Do